MNLFRMNSCVVVIVLLICSVKCFGSPTTTMPVEQKSLISTTSEDVEKSCDNLTESQELKEFEKLMSEVLASNKPALASRAAVGVAKWLMKLGTVAGTVTLAVWLDRMRHSGGLDASLKRLKKRLGFKKIKSYDLVNYLEYVAFALAIISLLIIPIVAERTVYKRDNSLAALQKLKTFLTELKSQKKRNILTLIKEAYTDLPDKLDKKLIQEKDSAWIYLGEMLPIIILSGIGKIAVSSVAYPAGGANAVKPWDEWPWEDKWIDWPKDVFLKWVLVAYFAAHIPAAFFSPSLYADKERVIKDVKAELAI